MVVIDSLTLDGVPSGSGVVVGFNDSLYIVGDDATSVYVLGKTGYHHKGIRIKSIPDSIYREPKPVKHDFESASAITVGGQQLFLAFGSGSKVPARDSLLVVNLRNPRDQVSVSLTRFYDSLRAQTSTGQVMWNIEGSSMTRYKVFLANRGNNMVITFDANVFLAYALEPGMPMPVATAWHKIDLPVLEGKQARLSGLSAINDSLLLFCASVEDTEDWVSDGPVLGSFVGVYSLNTGKVQNCYLLKGQDGTPMKEKLESVDKLKTGSGNTSEIVAISDNDNGSTKLFRIRFPVALP
ncbi:MAG: hypothetical protein EOO09_13320 [Chitinophagaceae bacterium]|nr:MAG: hypothetical protein EOO09_13320 [Chitinophagaceae bacterium]